MSILLTRRNWLFSTVGSAFALRPLTAASSKPMEGAFIIMATPYADTKAVDYEDLAAEVKFLDRCGVQGMVWPQMASEYDQLTEDERMEGMAILAEAAKGTKPALVLGVQGEDKAQMLRYATRAEELQPDALIAMPPKKAQSLDDFRDYYAALCKLAKRPVFIQTTGGAQGIEPTVEFIVSLAEEFENFGYIKEEYRPVTERMIELAKHRSEGIKALFSGFGGRGWTYEMRLGFDGTMPAAMYADVYALLWELHQQGDTKQLREVFSKLLLNLNTMQQIDGVRQYTMKHRGVFKTTVSRKGEFEFSDEEKAEIEFNFAALEPYLRA